MKQDRATYSAATVKALYEKQHPDLSVIQVCTSRSEAMDLVNAKDGRRIGLSSYRPFGFFVVSEERRK